MITSEDLKEIPVFACLDEQERRRLARLGADIHLEPGEWLFRESEEPHFFAILEGELEVLKDIFGTRKELRHSVAGEFSGELPIFLGRAFGKVDILVNNAGLYALSPVESLTLEGIQSIFSVNVFGLLLATKAALPLFPSEGGSIVNVGSVVGELAPPQAPVYAGTKGTLNSITRVFAKELAGRHIRVNAVNPRPIHTEGFEAAGFKDSPFEADMVQNTPLGRLGTPKDVADLVLYLASREAGWITGSLIDAAGGWR